MHSCFRSWLVNKTSSYSFISLKSIFFISLVVCSYLTVTSRAIMNTTVPEWMRWWLLTWWAWQRNVPFIFITNSIPASCWFSSSTVEGNFGSVYRGSHPPRPTLLLERAGNKPIVRTDNSNTTFYHQMYLLLRFVLVKIFNPHIIRELGGDFVSGFTSGPHHRFPKSTTYSHNIYTSRFSHM